MRFRFSGLILLVRFVVNDIKSLVGTIYLQISHLHPAQVSNQPSFLIWGIFALTRISFKLLTLQKTIIVTMPYYCSLLYVKRRCIMVIMFFNWAKEVWWAIFIAVFSFFFFFFFFFWFLSSFVFENFPAFKNYFRTKISTISPDRYILYWKMNFLNK